MSDERDAVDFAGFKDAGVPTQEDRVHGQAVSESREAGRSSDADTAVWRSKKTSGSSAGTVMGWLLGVGCVIALLAILDSTSEPRTTRQTPSSVPMVAPQPAPAETPAVTHSREEKPPVGVSVLTRGQLRWCVFWDWRIKKLAQGITDDPVVPAYNRLVDDYNSRCVNVSYYENDLTPVRRELEQHKGELESSVAAIEREWTQQYLVPVVRDIQRSLTQLGYNPGPIDGVVGPQTRNAIREIERDYGVEQTGLANIALRDALRELAGRR